MDEIWVEKYRPQKLGEIVGQEEVVTRLHGYVKRGNLPHLLFSGPPGTGKTTSAIALSKELFGDDWRSNFHELNASDERGIDVVRGKIKEYARTAPISAAGGLAAFKVIFLDEADALTNDAQNALRRTMEKFSHTARFVLSCNYSSRIIDPIQSRCAVFRFRPLRPEDITKMVRRIAKEEQLDVTKEGLDALLYVAGGDLRRAVNTLQVAGALGKKVDEDSIYKTTATARPEDVKQMLESAVQGDFLKARDLLDGMLVTYGLSGEDVVRQVHRAVLDLAVDDALKVALMDRVGEADFRLVQGANERVQVEALLAHFTLAAHQAGVTGGGVKKR